MDLRKSTKDPVKAIFQPPFRTSFRMSRGGNSLHRVTISLKRTFPVGGRREFLLKYHFYRCGRFLSRWNGWPRLFPKILLVYRKNTANVSRTSRFRRLSFSYPRLGTKKKKKENPWAVSRERNLPIIFNTLRHTSRKMVGRTLFQEESFVELEGRILTCGDAIRFSSLVSEMYYYYYYYLR